MRFKYMLLFVVLILTFAAPAFTQTIDLYIADMKVVKDLVNDKSYVSLRIGNAGNLASTPCFCEVIAYYGSASQSNGQTEVPAVPPSGFVWTAAIVYGGEGYHTFAGEVDYTSLVTETDEGNNTKSTSHIEYTIPKSSGEFQLVVYDPTGEGVTIDLSHNFPSGWDVSFSPPSIILGPDEVDSVTVFFSELKGEKALSQFQLYGEYGGDAPIKWDIRVHWGRVPALNIFGTIALILVLVGTVVYLYRRNRQTA